MDTTPIIDASRSRRWYQRMLSSSFTVALWTGWASLWTPILQGVSRIPQLRLLVQGAALPREMGLATHALTPAAATLLGTSSLLLLWQFLITRRQPAAAVCGARMAEPSLADFAARCGLSPAELLAAREHSVVVVHHADDGRIERVLSRGA